MRKQIVIRFPEELTEGSIITFAHEALHYSGVLTHWNSTIDDPELPCGELVQNDLMFSGGGGSRKFSSP